MSTGIVTRRKSAMHIDNSYGIDVVAANTNLVSKRVLKGEPFITQIVCDEGYSIYEITIEMGGVDITSTAYDPTYNMISIASVTDDVDIECYAMHTMPSDYVRVDGIKNPSNAWMDTGYNPDQNTRLDIKVKLVKAASGYTNIAASKTAALPNANGSGWYIHSNGTLYCLGGRTGQIAPSIPSPAPVGNVYEFVANYYTNTHITNGSITQNFGQRKNDTDPYHMSLYSRHDGADSDKTAGQIIYYFHIYDYATTSYVRYYIPCLNASGVAGFWDAARGVFQGSSNSTAFEAVAADGGDFRLINFEDSAVKNICVTNWGGHYKAGEMYTPEARAVTTIGAQFRGNTTITKFNEFKYFTNVNSIPNSTYSMGLFTGCKNLLEVSLPPLTNVTNFTGLFNDCFYLETVDFSLLTERTADVNISRMFGSSGIYEADVRAFKNINYLNAAFIGTTGYVRLTKVITTGCNFSRLTADSAIGSAFYNVYRLNTIEGGLTGLKRTVDLGSCPLSVASATEVLTSLSTTPVSGAKITLRSGSRSTYEADADFNAAVTAVTNNGWTVAYR